MSGSEGGSADEDAEDQERPENEDMPRTREELYKLKEKYGNNRRLAAHFYRNRAIQLEMRMLYLGGAPLAREFSCMVKLFQKGQVPGGLC